MASAPPERGYQQRVAPGGMARLPADATPAAFGGGVGSEMERLGAQLERSKDANDTAAAGVAMAQARLGFSRDLVDLQQNLRPGAAGYSDDVAALAKKHFDPVLDGIGNSSVRAKLEPEVAEYTTAQQANAYEFQTVKGREQRYIDGDQQLSTSVDRLQRDDSDQAHVEESLAWDKTAEAMGGPADLNKKVYLQGLEKLNAAHLEGIINNGKPQQVLDKLKTGEWDGQLADGEGQRLRLKAETAIAHQAAQANEAANQEKAQVREDAEQIGREVADGHHVDPARFASTGAAAKRLGLDDKVYKVGEWQLRQSVNDSTLPLAPPGYRQIEDTLAAKAANHTITKDEETVLDQIRLIAPKRIEQYYKDPHAHAAAYGVPAPPIDQATGQGFADRTNWQRAQLQARGGVFTPTLDPDEAAPHIQMIQHGSPSQRFAEAQYILGWRDGGPNVLRQLSPDPNSAFSQAVALGEVNPSAMHDAILGADASKALPSFKPDEKDPGTLRRALAPGLDDPNPRPLSAEEIVTATVGPALERMGPAYLGGVIANSKNAYARVAQTAGFMEKLHGGELQVQVNRVLGGYRDRDKVWHGGLGLSNGVRTVLPPTVTQQQFDQVGARASADGYALAAGGRVPHYSDRPLTTQDLQSAVKVWLGGNTYALKIPDRFGVPGFVSDEHGRPWSFRFDLLAKNPGGLNPTALGYSQQGQRR